MVVFLEPVSHTKLVSVYHAHDVLVLPSYNEAIGMVVPEAMACGIPTITSDTVGANVYVQEGETGYVFPTSDVEALAQTLEKLCDPAELAKMGQAARERIETEFTIEKSAEKFRHAIGL